MDRPKRRNMLLDLRAVDDKIRLWVDVEDLDEDKPAPGAADRPGSARGPDRQARLGRSLLGLAVVGEPGVDVRLIKRLAALSA